MGSETEKLMVPSSIGDRARWVVDELTRRGCRIQAGSRLDVYAKALDRNGYLDPTNQSQFLQGVIATRDILEIAQILAQFPELGAADLQVLQKDAPEPKQLAHAPGRDRQHELSVGATCRAGGMTVLLDREPDIWCVVGRVHIGLAAKRVKSEKRFIENLRNAADQIDECELRHGIAIIDTTLGWNPDHTMVVSHRHDADVGASLVERLHRFISQKYSDIGDVFNRSDKLLGLLIVDWTPSSHPVQGLKWSRCSQFVTSDHINRWGSRVWNGFMQRWSRGCPNMSPIVEAAIQNAAVTAPSDLLMPLRTNA